MLKKNLPKLTNKEQGYQTTSLTNQTEEKDSTLAAGKKSLLSSSKAAKTSGGYVKQYTEEVETWTKHVNVLKANYERNPNAQNAEYYRMAAERLDSAQKRLQANLERYTTAQKELDARKNAVEEYKKSTKELQTARYEAQLERQNAGWLNLDNAAKDADSASKRQGIYSQNQESVENIEKQIEQLRSSATPQYYAAGGAAKTSGTGYGAMGEYQAQQDALRSMYGKTGDAEINDEVWDLLRQKSQLEQQNRIYERFQQGADNGYTVAQNSDFSEASREYSGQTEDRLGTYLNASGEDKRRAMEMLLADTTETVGSQNQFLSSVMQQTDDQMYRSQIILKGDESNWDQLDDTEIGIYYYLREHEGQESADEWLDSMTVTLNRRANQKMIEEHQELTAEQKVLANVASVITNTAGGVIAAADDAYQVLTGNDINPYNAKHFGQNFTSSVRGATANSIEEAIDTEKHPNLAKVASNTYQAIMSGIDSAVGGTLMGNGYMVSMGLSAASQRAQEMYEQGATREEIALGAIGSGVIETLTEKVSLEYFFQNFLEQPVKGWGDFIKKTLTQAGIEGSEELASEVGNMLWDSITRGAASDHEQLIQAYIDSGMSEEEARTQAVKDKIEEYWWALYGGMISGGGMGAIGSGGNLLSQNLYGRMYYNQQGRDVMRSGANAYLTDAAYDALTVDNENASDYRLEENDQLMALAREVAGVTEEDYSSMNRRQQEQTARKAGQVLRGVEAARSRVAESEEKAFRQKAAASLENAGVHQTRKAVDVLVKSVYEDTLSEQEQKIYDQIDGGRIVSEVLSSQEPVSASRMEQMPSMQKNTETEGNLTSAENEPTESRYEASADGKTILNSTGETVAIQEIASIKDGRMTLRLEDGRIVGADEVSYASEGEALVYAAVVDMGVNAAAANVLLEDYRMAPNISGEAYAKGMKDAYLYGVKDYPANELANGTFTSQLTENQRMHAYRLGRSGTTTEKISTDAKKAATAKKSIRRMGRVKSYGVTIAETNKAFNVSQQKAYKILSTISEVTGIDVVLYKSKVGKNGELAAGVVDGIDMTGAQGAFSFHNDKIYIDINAGLINKAEMGDVAKYSMLRTFSHEFTHFIEKWNPVEYENFRNLVFETMRKNGGDPEALIDERMSKEKKPDRESASREVVAEAMTDILPQSSFVETLAQKHRNLFRKLHEKLREFAQRIRDYFGSIGMNTSAEAAILKESVGEGVRYTEDIVKMFDRIAEQAVEHYQAAKTAQKNTASESGAKYQFRGYAEDGKGIYESNFPLGTPKRAKGERILKYIQDVWSKKPITLRIEDASGIRYIEARFDPVFDEGENARTDASKLMGGNRHGTSAEQRVTLDLADDYYQLATESKYNGSKEETGKQTATHQGVKTWHYFVNDIYFAEYGSDNLTPYTVSINVKEKADGNFFYSFSAEHAEKNGGTSTQRTLHAVVNSNENVAANGNPFDNIISANNEHVNTQNTNAKYQERTSTLTNREILANALGTVAQSDSEKVALQKYRENIQNAEKLEAEVAESRKELRELRGKKGKTRGEKSRIAELQNDIAEAESKLKGYDAALLKLEAAKPIKAMLARERTRAQRMIRTNYKERASINKQRAIVEKQVKELTKMIVNPTKDAHVPTALHKPLQKLFDSLDFSSRQATSGGEVTVRDVAYTRALQNIRTAIAAQRTAMEGAEEGTFTLDIPPEFLEKIDAHIKTVSDATENLGLTTDRVYEMSGDELKVLADLLGTINKAIRNIDKVLAEGAIGRISELGESTIGEMGRRKPVKDETGGNAMWANYTPTHAFERMGTAATQILDGLKQGQTKMARTVDGVIRFAKETYTDDEVKQWEEKTHVVKLEAGESVKLTTAQIMSFYCLSSRIQGVRHLTGGGIRVSTIGEGPGRTVQKQHFRLTTQDIDQINGLLDNRQRSVAEALQKYMQDVGGKLGNEISMARWGFMQMTEENYFPIRSDSDVLDGKNPDQEKANLWALVNKSFTKSTKEKANNAIVVSSIFDVFADHMSEMAEYNAFALPLVDAMKWYNYRNTTRLDGTQIDTVGVKKALNDTLGTSAGKYFIDLMTDINSSQKGGRHEDFMGKILNHSKASAVGWNLRVAIQQPTAILRASLYLDLPSLANGSLRIGTKKLVEEMKKYSGIALWKSLGYYDLNVSRSVREQIKGDTGLLDKFNEWGMWLPGKMDEITWVRIWAACKSQVSKAKNLTGEKLMQETAKLFDDVVYHTQVVDSVLTKSSLMRSKSQLIKEFSSFMAEPTVSVNILMSAFQDYRQGKTKWDKAKRTFAICFKGYALSAIVNAFVTAFADAFRDDDDYEEFWEKYQQALLGSNFVDGNLFAELNPLEKIVFVKDILSLARGYDVMHPYIKLIQNCVDLLDDIKRYLEGKGSITKYGIIYKSLKVLGDFTGASPANLAREAVTIWNNTRGVLYPEEKIYQYQTDVKTKIHNAFDAGALTKEEAIRELVLAQEVENEDDAYFLVKKWVNGENSKYADLYDAVYKGESIDAAMEELTSHGMKEEDVLGTVKNKIHEWYCDPESDIHLTREEAISRLKKYSDLENDEIQALVKKWDLKKDAGISYDDLKEQYADGSLTEQQALTYLQKYGSKTKAEAQEQLEDWVKDLFYGKEITNERATDILTKHCGWDRTDAESRVQYWEYKRSHPNLYVDDAWIEEYDIEVRDSGISLDTFIEYRNKVKGITGKGKKESRMAVIDSLPITSEQKDTLYFAEGWAVSTLHEAPWH